MIDIIARYNFQKNDGNGNNTLSEDTVIDRYIIAKQENRNRLRWIIDGNAYNEMLEATKKDVTKVAEQALEGVLKNFR